MAASLGERSWVGRMGVMIKKHNFTSHQLVPSKGGPLNAWLILKSRLDEVPQTYNSSAQKAETGR